jgi:hypothetical protein
VKVNPLTRIERAESYIDNLADVIDDVLGDDDSVNWPHELRNVAVELRAVTMALGQQQAETVGALELVASERRVNARGQIEPRPSLAAEIAITTLAALRERYPVPVQIATPERP